MSQAALLQGVGLEPDHVGAEVVVAVLAEEGEEAVALVDEALVAELVGCVEQAVVPGGAHEAVERWGEGEVGYGAVAPGRSQPEGVAE